MVEFSILRRLRRSVVNSALICSCSLYMEREGPVFCAGGCMLETPLAEFSIGSSAKNGRFQAIYRRLFLCRLPIV